MRQATLRRLLIITLPLLSWSCAKTDREPFGEGQVRMLQVDVRAESRLCGSRSGPLLHSSCAGEGDLFARHVTGPARAVGP